MSTLHTVSNYYQWFVTLSILHCFTAPQWVHTPILLMNWTMHYWMLVGKSPQLPCYLLNHLLFWPEYAPMSHAAAGVIATSQRWRSLQHAWQGPNSWSGRYRMLQSGAEFVITRDNPGCAGTIWPFRYTIQNDEVYGQSSTTCYDIPFRGYVHAQNNLAPKHLFSWPELESGQSDLPSGQNGPQLGKMFEKWAKKIFILSRRPPLALILLPP